MTVVEPKHRWSNDSSILLNCNDCKEIDAIATKYYIEEQPNKLNSVSTNLWQNHTILTLAHIGVSLLGTALTYINVHSKTSVTEPNHRSQNDSSYLINYNDCNKWK